MNSLRVALFALLAFSPVASFADCIAGTYKAHGVFSDTGETYTAKVVIKKKQGYYTIKWNFDNGAVETGSGVRKGSAVSFFFTNPDCGDECLGTQLYRIHGHKLEGPWVLKTHKIGQEKLQLVHKKKCHKSSSYDSSSS